MSLKDFELLSDTTCCVTQSLGDAESGWEGGESERRVTRSGPVDSVLAKSGDGLDWGVTVEVQRSGCALRLLKAGPSGRAIVWFWSIKEREGSWMAPRLFYLSTCVDGTPVFGMGRTGSLERSCGGENHSFCFGCNTFEICTCHVDSWVYVQGEVRSGDKTQGHQYIFKAIRVDENI